MPRSVLEDWPADERSQDVHRSARRDHVVGGQWNAMVSHGPRCNASNLTCGGRETSVVHWWAHASRVGEAGNPGPLAVTVMAGGLLRRAYRKARAAVSYPKPGTGSLRGAIAPGFAPPRQTPADEGHFALRIEAANTTGWRPLQRRIRTTTAHVLLVQETWLTQDAIHAASSWARRNGWKSVWSAAVPGPNGGASGGTAILARDYLGLRFPPSGSHEWVPGRAVAAVLDAPEHRPMILVSTYFYHGVGPGAANLEMMATIGRKARAIEQHYEIVMGGTSIWSPPTSPLRVSTWK